jgi:hypothetical protein
MKIKIESDGTTAGTSVVDENGSRVGYVQEIVWRIKVGELATCSILLTKMPASIMANEFTMVEELCAQCKSELAGNPYKGICSCGNNISGPLNEK